jgi:hydrogenase maturation protein HypF
LAHIRRRVHVSGVVQGVGFRPFVYRLAVEELLAGHISNNTAGVTIEIEGADAAVVSFLDRLRAETPPLAHIDAIRVEEIAIQGSTGFHIDSSAVIGSVVTSIPADAATCEDCRRELLTPGDRRFRYAFTNCTNCGPRFTITRSIPYDRPHTSMAQFKMCAQCQAEYDDPLNRRFHAQPNACWDCGPRLWLTAADGSEIPAVDAIDETVRRLTAGEIVAIKGIGGFHLAVDATNEEAVQRLRARKHRHGKPLAVMLPNADAVQARCTLSAEERRLLTGTERPIVLLRIRSAGDIAESVAPGLPWHGVFLPYSPIHHLLFASGELKVLVMTSANLSEEPIAIDNDEALARLGGIADAFLFHNREILQRCDDSVLQVVEDAPQIIRRARGYVPLPIALPFDSPHLLAVGGHLKSVFCLTSGRNAYQSQHLGDLENLTGQQFFEEALAHLKQTFEIEPRMIVHDQHPGYLSTQWAERQGLPLLGAQHHHAHIAACMAEHGLAGPVIGLALDGTGYGTDGAVWGGEVLLASYTGFERFAYLRYTAMPGSSAAIHQPWRMALSHLLAAVGDRALKPDVLDFLGSSLADAKLLARMIERDINSPLTSSCGRLFDAAAVLITGRRVVDYEAQSAIELEGLLVASESTPDCSEDRDGYSMPLVAGSEAWGDDGPEGKRESWILDPAPLLASILEDRLDGVSSEVMSVRFHRTVAQTYAQAVVQARRLTGVQRVCFSGGVFHNRVLTRMLHRRLIDDGFEVFTHARVSPGDGGLSYGQAAIGAAYFAQERA